MIRRSAFKAIAGMLGLGMLSKRKKGLDSYSLQIDQLPAELQNENVARILHRHDPYACWGFS